ncbi:hypothetical protein [Klebsiella quasipneumoniae]|uniref:hypothetical protein n=1 Tax=Klebsiella quasipneumoniae TaxID=1463165 RepID=UPI000F2BDAA6|nr:hypothetical protein [Klebsiella quasipneumoniae]VCX69126.1 hypothetical protein BANRA_05557 [Klebsiella quasipneumoniae]
MYIVVTQYPDIDISGKFYDLTQAKIEFKTQLGCNVMACIEVQRGRIVLARTFEKHIG